VTYVRSGCRMSEWLPSSRNLLFLLHGPFSSDFLRPRCWCYPCPLSILRSIVCDVRTFGLQIILGLYNVYLRPDILLSYCIVRFFGDRRVPRPDVAPGCACYLYAALFAIRRSLCAVDRVPHAVSFDAAICATRRSSSEGKVNRCSLPTERPTDVLL
jgi:hypothetical protein